MSAAELLDRATAEAVHPVKPRTQSEVELDATVESWHTGSRITWARDLDSPAGKQRRELVAVEADRYGERQLMRLAARAAHDAAVQAERGAPWSGPRRRLSVDERTALASEAVILALEAGPGNGRPPRPGDIAEGMLNPHRKTDWAGSSAPERDRVALADATAKLIGDPRRGTPTWADVSAHASMDAAGIDPADIEAVAATQAAERSDLPPLGDDSPLGPITESAIARARLSRPERRAVRWHLSAERTCLQDWRRHPLDGAPAETFRRDCYRGALSLADRAPEPGRLPPEVAHIARAEDGHPEPDLAAIMAEPAGPTAPYRRPSERERLTTRTG